jgi:amino acid adenylation domain-containing protein
MSPPATAKLSREEKRALLAQLLEKKALKPKRFPLSFAQQRLWFLEQLIPNTPAYNVTITLQLTGSLQIGALQRSLNTIVRRHEPLRTTFSVEDGQPIQSINPPRQLRLPLLDLRALPASQRERQARSLIYVAGVRPFDLARGPLFHACLLCLDDDEHVLLLLLHHIIFDEWSQGIFFHELTTLYAAEVAGQPARLPELPIQYADYAIWQREWLQGDVLEAQLAYWRRQLAGAPAILELTTDRPRPLVQTFHGADYRFALAPSLCTALQALSREAGATLFMTLLAAFQLLLARYIGRNNITVAVPLVGRTRTELEGLIGFFVNTLALHTDLHGNPSFREALGRVREVCLGGFAHQELPFEKLVEELRLDRNLSHPPLAQTAFDLQRRSDHRLVFPGLTWRWWNADAVVAKLDLALFMQEAALGLEAALEYNTDLFDLATIGRMAGHLQILLEGIVADPDRRISDLPLLTEAERGELLAVAPIHSAVPPETSLHRLLEAQAERVPDSVALIVEQAHTTYRELNRRANQLAHFLAGRNMHSGTLIGLCMERSQELIIGLLGILKVGGAYVPLDPSYPPERLAFVLKDTQTPLLLTQQSLAATLSANCAQMLCLDAEWPAIEACSAANPSSVIVADHPVYVIYTSGSTGQPKGVVVVQRGIVNLALSMAEEIGLGTSQRFLQFASFSFDASAIQLFPTLISGATLVLHPNPSQLTNQELLDLCDRQQITVLDLPAAFWHQWVADLAAQGRRLPGSVRMCMTGGERVTRESLHLWAGIAGKSTGFLSSYGPTEATVTTMIFTTTSAAATHLDIPNVLLGDPIANTRIYLLDRHMRLVPIGVPGEIYIAGIGVARGYLGRPDLTAERFVPNPFADRAKQPSSAAENILQSTICNLQSAIGTRLYRTGDLARHGPDGRVTFLGRVDDQVKIRGFRIEPGEVAAAIRQHPRVREVVVVAREDPRDDKQLVAYVVARTGDSTGSSQAAHTGDDAVSLILQLRTFLAARLPAHMLPAAFVQLDELPLNANGKIDRLALPAPDRAQTADGHAGVTPRNLLERQLVQIWEDLLGTAPIGVTDNFFDQGGHSLLVVRLMAQIQNQFGRSLPLASLFEGATIAQLAGVLRRDPDTSRWSPVVQIQSGGARRPFFCIHPIGGSALVYLNLARYLGKDQPFYGLEAPNLADIDRSELRIEDMAAQYVEAVRQVEPHGPYLLGGWSFGGVVAFEMAQQLQQMGQEVRLLVLIDSHPPATAGSVAHLSDAELLIGLAREHALQTGKPFSVSLDDLGQIEPERHLDYVLDQIKAHGLEFGSEPEWARRFVRGFKARDRAGQAYRPQIYPGRVTLIKAGEEDAELIKLLDTMGADQGNPTNGWDALSLQPVECIVVPGYHALLLYEPYVRVVADRLCACLELTQTAQVAAS